MDNFEKQNIEQDSYKTGDTMPPKRRGGLVAGLLIAVILLAGVSSILGLMNIQLFRMLEEERNPVAFAPNETKATAHGQTAGKPELGLSAEDISELDQRYFQLPAGVLISEVDARGCAAAAGLAAGDIILSFKGVKVETAADLEQAMEKCSTGERVEIEFYRYSTQMQQKVTVTLENTEN